VLNRIARALMLTDVEREHLYLLDLGRRPRCAIKRAKASRHGRKRVLDALEPSPALIR